MISNRHCSLRGHPQPIRIKDSQAFICIVRSQPYIAQILLIIALIVGQQNGEPPFDEPAQSACVIPLEPVPRMSKKRLSQLELLQVHRFANSSPETISLQLWLAEGYSETLLHPKTDLVRPVM